MSTAPNDLKGLRACLGCSLVKTEQQFLQSGCANCDNLGLKGSRQRVQDCTSASFDGLISLMDPDGSWVARWQRINGAGFQPGCYAISVQGRLPAYAGGEEEEAI